nr:MAG TPA: restriction alleviation protein [Bacteriophage sp.]
MEKSNPCRYCGKSNIAIERWRSGGMMYMCK